MEVLRVGRVNGADCAMGALAWMLRRGFGDLSRPVKREYLRGPVSSRAPGGGGSHLSEYGVAGGVGACEVQGTVPGGKPGDVAGSVGLNPWW